MGFLLSSLTECRSSLCLALGSLLILKMLFLGAGGDPFEEGSAVTSDPCAAFIPQPTQSSPSSGQAGLPFSFIALLVGV